MPIDMRYSFKQQLKAICRYACNWKKLPSRQPREKEASIWFIRNLKCTKRLDQSFAIYMKSIEADYPYAAGTQVWQRIIFRRRNAITIEKVGTDSGHRTFKASKKPLNKGFSWHLEQMRGIEPPYQPWQGCDLPLNYICIFQHVYISISKLK